jgi:hypothetical protein
MAVIKIKTPPVHGFRVVCVANEDIQCEVHEIECLEDPEGVKYKIHSWFSYEKTDIWPGGMMKLATGLDLKANDVWGKCSKSDKLIFFIVEINIPTLFDAI